MPPKEFNRDAMARWYAQEHLKTDPAITAVYYLPKNANEREIRFVEINQLMGQRTDETLEPIDFGVDTGTDSEHQLFVVDVTPEQWERIRIQQLPLPNNWSLEGAIHYNHE